MKLPSMVFETIASAIPPLRLVMPGCASLTNRNIPDACAIVKSSFVSRAGNTPLCKRCIDRTMTSVISTGTRVQWHDVHANPARVYERCSTALTYGAALWFYAVLHGMHA